MNPPKCTSLWGHKYEGRYSLSAPDLSQFTRLKAENAYAFLEGMKAKTYERDICVRCGHVVEKKP